MEGGKIWSLSIFRKRYLFAEFSNQDPYTAYPMVNLQQSVLLLMIPSKDWVRPVHRNSIGMLGSDSVPVTESHDKLHKWLTRVKPVNSFLSDVLPDQHGRHAEHDLSEISAIWLNVNLGKATENSNEQTIKIEMDLTFYGIFVLLDFIDIVVKKQQVWSFTDHLDLKKGHALCLHRWKIWWSIPKLLKSKCPEDDVPPETYFLLSQFQVTTFVCVYNQTFPDLPSCFCNN